MFPKLEPHGVTPLITMHTYKFWQFNLKEKLHSRVSPHHGAGSSEIWYVKTTKHFVSIPFQRASQNLVLVPLAHLACSKFPKFTTQIRNRIFLHKTSHIAQENIISVHQSEGNRRWHQAPRQIKAVLISKLDFQPVPGWVADGFWSLQS